MPSNTKNNTKNAKPSKSVETTTEHKDVSAKAEPIKVESVKAAPAKAAPAKATPAKATPSKAVVAAPVAVAAAAKKDVEPKKGGATESETNDRKQRSFKVKLPGSADFSGRFTGLTPYQAGNKALSKYFRTNTTVKPNKTITIEIQESTRNSKKGTYTYEGSRIKLEIPVEYEIRDGDNIRKIVKEFKNKLIKKKKTVEASA
jgi:hypothetical protein